MTIQTLFETDSLTEAMEMAEGLYALSIENDDTVAASILKVQEIEITDSLTGTIIETTYRVIGTDGNPRQGRIVFENGKAA